MACFPFPWLLALLGELLPASQSQSQAAHRFTRALLYIGAGCSRHEDLACAFLSHRTHLTVISHRVIEAGFALCYVPPPDPNYRTVISHRVIGRSHASCLASWPTAFPEIGEEVVYMTYGNADERNRLRAGLHGRRCSRCPFSS